MRFPWSRSRAVKSPGPSSTQRNGIDASAWLARAGALQAEGNLLDAIDAVTRANRLRREPDLEHRLVRLRHEAFTQIDRTSGPSSWPVIAPGDDLATTRPPVASPDELTPQLLSTAIWKHGCLHVRRLVPEDQVGLLVDGIDKAIAGFDAHASGLSASDTTPWFEPFVPRPGYSIGVKRKWVRDSGGVWTADSPRVLSDLVDTIDSVGLGQAIAAYFGERPALSVNKCTLRRVALDTKDANWHQDGAFLGDGI